MRKRIWPLTVLLLLAGLLYGPLFAWSPVTPEFTRTRHGGIEFLHRSEHPPQSAALEAAGDIRTLETELALSMRGPVTIVLCDEWDDLRRFTPWLAVDRQVGARTMEFGTVIYVTPLARDRWDVADFIRHELIHVLLLRNTSMGSRLAVSDHWWLVEGLAVVYGNPGAYPLPSGGRLDALRAVLPQLLDPDRDPDSANATTAERYALAGAFVRHLESRYGPGTFRSFLTDYLSAPRDWRRAFAVAFGTSFETAVGRFRP